MSKNDSFDKWMFVGMILVLAFVGVSLLINSNKACDVNIDYKVSVDSNQTNISANTLEIKFACYKLCIEGSKSFGSDMMDKCLNKCDGLK